LQLRLLGAELLDIRQHAAASDPPWNVSDRQLFRYIADADDLLATMLESNRTRLFARHVGQRRALFARCMATSDYRTAAGVLKDEAAMLGLYGAASKPTAATEATIESAADVAKMLAARLREVDQADMPAAERTRLTATLSDALLRAIDAGETQAKLDELLGRLDDAEAKRKAGER